MAAALDRPLQLRAYVRPYRRAIAGLTGGLLVATALPLLGPQLIRRFVDLAIAGVPVRDLVMIAVTYLAVALSAQVTNIAVSYWTGRIAWGATNRLREDLAEHVLGLDLSFHVHRTAGELIERIDGDVTALAEFLSRFLLQVVGSALLLVGAVALVWRENTVIGAVLVVYIAVAFVAMARLQRRTIPAATANREAQAQLFGQLEERLAALDDVRALGAGQHVVRRFHEASAELYRRFRAWQFVSGGMFVVTNLVFAAGTALLLVLGIWFLDRGVLTVGTVLLLFQYAALVRRPLEQIAAQFKEFQQATAGIARVRELMSLRPSITAPARAATLPAGAIDVELEDVTFAYPDDPAVLHDVSLRIPAGTSLGLVGRTGSGKTSIARLLLRLYDPTAGVVRGGGHDLRQVDLASLRRRVRMVTQDVQLFAADVRDNLTLFGSTPPEDVLVDVLTTVGLRTWYETLPDGLDTRLGGGGIGVSAGEAQLLALARVFLADPGLVVLDEASSRLDPVTEGLIEDAIHRLLAGRTAVIIAHRLSSLERVDAIAVIDRGRIVEHGPREALAADPTSRYARLVALGRGVHR